MSVCVHIRRHAAVAGALVACAAGAGLRAQAPAPSGWQTSAQVVQGFDNNVLLSTTNPQGAATTQYQLSLGRVWSGPRWSFAATFAPEGETYLGHSNLNYFGESYQQAWSYSWLHTQLTWSATASRMPERAGAPGMGLTGAASAANASLSLALATVLTNANTSLNLTHQYSLHSTWSANVSASLMSFTQDKKLVAVLAQGNPLVFQSSTLTRSHSAGGGISWSHALSPSRSVTFGANANQMWYTPQALRYYSIEASLQQKLGAAMTLDLGGGPAWNQTVAAAGQPVSGGLSGASYAAHAGLTLQRGRSQYGVTWNRSEQASLVPGGVTTQMVGLQYSVQWGRAWSAGASAGYSQYAGFASTGGGHGSTYASGQIGHRISNDVSLFGSFSYGRQTLPTAAGASVPLNLVNASIGLSYQPGGAH